MFIMMLVGFICGKTGLIDFDGNKKLSRLSLWLVNPMIIFMSFQSEYSPRIAKNLAITFALCITVYALHIAVATLIVPKKNKEYAVERMSLIFSNNAFIGIPLVSSVFGKDGVIYLTMSIAAFNILIWTYGVTLMKGEKTNLRESLKKLCTPAIISVILGIVCFLCRFTLPNVIAEPLDTIGSMNTPLAMLVAGSTLAGTNLLGCLKKPRLYLICFLKLLALPALSALSIFWLAHFGVSPMAISVVMIATACPSAAAVTMFAHAYNRDSVWASEIFAMSTLFSVVSIPAIMWFVEFLGVVS